MKIFSMQTLISYTPVRINSNWNMHKNNNLIDLMLA